MKSSSQSNKRFFPVARSTVFVAAVHVTVCAYSCYWIQRTTRSRPPFIQLTVKSLCSFNLNCKRDLFACLFDYVLFATAFFHQLAIRATWIESYPNASTYRWYISKDSKLYFLVCSAPGHESIHANSGLIATQKMVWVVMVCIEK